MDGDTAYDGRCLPSETEDDMTLVIACTAADGSLVAADRRDLDVRSFVYNDEALKHQRTVGNCVVGYCGPGQWVESLLARNEYPSSDPYVTAGAVSLGLTPNFPDVDTVIAGVQPKPQVALLTRKSIAGGLAWTGPAEWPKPWVLLGFKGVAHVLFSMWWYPGIDLDSAATLAVTAIKVTAMGYATVSPDWTLDCIRSSGLPWTAADTKRIDDLSSAHVEKLKAVKP